MILASWTERKKNEIKIDYEDEEREAVKYTWLRVGIRKELENNEAPRELKMQFSKQETSFAVANTVTHCWENERIKSDIMWDNLLKNK